MSYPGRPSLIPGVPVPQSMAYMPIGGPPPSLLQPVMPLQHMMPVTVQAAPQLRNFRQSNSIRAVSGGMLSTTPPVVSAPPLLQPQLKNSDGPPVTVFIGNITEKAPDTMVRQILAACGPVISWKRVQAFGFCELAGPEAGLRAVRLLHDRMIGEKRLVAKVDAKTKTVLDEYKVERRKKVHNERGRDSPVDSVDDDNYLDDEMREIDKHAIERISSIIHEYREEMSNYQSHLQEEQLEKRKKILDEADIEEGKRDLITREIGKFREIMKKQEHEKEVSRRQREKDRGDRGDETRDRAERDRERNREEREISIEREREEIKPRKRSRSRSRERERERERGERDREREKERERDRERDRDRDREREREREREEMKTKSSKELLKEKEMEEEAKEKKKADRRAREKEAAYQERLRAWETRERRKAKDYDKEREKERVKEEEREKDAKRLKEFLEDYDDERDDVKYYKGRELQRRLAERLKEAESDTRDREKEKDELEELKSKIFSSAYEDPTAEFEKLRREREDLYKPRLLIDVNLEQSKQREKEREREMQRQLARQREAQREADRERDRQRDKQERERYIVEQAAQELAAVEAEPIDSDSDMDSQHFDDGGHTPEPMHQPPPPSKLMDIHNNHAPDEDTRMSVISSLNENSLDAQTTPMSGFNSAMGGTGEKMLSKPITFSPNQNANIIKDKKKKVDLKEVFNTDDDDESTISNSKKRKLVPLDYNEDKEKKVKKDKAEKKSEDTVKIQDEKRKNIKALIDKIPTEKNALFAFQLDWSVIDTNLMEKRIRPWINKKIIEYIGEPEPTLVDFICSKVLAGSQPQGILDDVQMVLDEEAEVFVVKMWRLLIYEVEAKKLGLVK